MESMDQRPTPSCVSVVGPVSDPPARSCPLRHPDVSLWRATRQRAPRARGQPDVEASRAEAGRPGGRVSVNFIIARLGTAFNRILLLVFLLWSRRSFVRNGFQDCRAQMIRDGLQTCVPAFFCMPAVPGQVALDAAEILRRRVKIQTPADAKYFVPPLRSAEPHGGKLMTPLVYVGEALPERLATRTAR